MSRPLFRALPLLLATLPAAPALAQAPSAAPATAALTIEQAMADPDWIGPPVEQAWWRWDGQAALYTAKRPGATVRDIWQAGLDGAAPVKLDDAARAGLDADGAVIDARGERSAFVRNGDVFVRDLRNGELITGEGELIQTCVTAPAGPVDLEV